MGNRPVSIVLPCFNAEHVLPDALETIRAQTCPDWEMILVEDGSTDGTRAVARSFAAADDRIRVIDTPHSGILRALQTGCQEARGTYIARMDADDIAHPDRIAKQFAFMEEHPDIALCGTLVRIVGADGKEPPDPDSGRGRYETWINGLVSHDAIVRDLFVECAIAHPTFFLRSDAYHEVQGYEGPSSASESWPEDYDLCMRLYLAGKRFGKVAECLLQWRDTSGRLSMTDPRYGLDRFRALKRHYLFRSYLGDERPFYQWGAGEVGKVWLREWGTRRPLAVVDVNPRKIGRNIHDVPVIDADDLPPPGESFVLVAVGAPGAREDIRAWFCSRGYRETEDYLFVA